MYKHISCNFQSDKKPVNESHTNSSKHINNDNPQSDLCCKICNSTFSSTNNLRTHMNSNIHQKNESALKIKMLEEEVENLKQQKQTNITNNTNIINVTNTNIVDNINNANIVNTQLLKLVSNDTPKSTSLKKNKDKKINNYGTYECISCNFKSDRKFNYETHIQSSKHLNKVNGFEHDTHCKMCDSKFSSIDSLRTHFKSKIHNKNKIKMDEEMKITNNTLLAINELKKEIENLKQNANNPNNINKSTTVIGYVEQNFANAPPLKKLTSEEISKIILINKYTVTEVSNFLLECDNVNKLCKNIATIISNHFLNTPTQMRPIWTSDSSRFMFIIKHGENNINSVWIRDKNCKIINEFLINPVLEKISNMVTEFMKQINIKKQQNDFFISTCTHLKMKFTAEQLLMHIKEGTLIKKILHHMTKTFTIDQTLLKQHNSNVPIPKKRGRPSNPKKIIINDYIAITRKDNEIKNGKKRNIVDLNESDNIGKISCSKYESDTDIDSDSNSNDNYQENSDNNSDSNLFNISQKPKKLLKIFS